MFITSSFILYLPPFFQQKRVFNQLRCYLPSSFIICIQPKYLLFYFIFTLIFTIQTKLNSIYLFPWLMGCCVNKGRPRVGQALGWSSSIERLVYTRSRPNQNKAQPTKKQLIKTGQEGKVKFAFATEAQAIKLANSYNKQS